MLLTQCVAAMPKPKHFVPDEGLGLDLENAYRVLIRAYARTHCGADSVSTFIRKTERDARTSHMGSH